MSTRDFIPTRSGDRSIWLQSLGGKIDTVAKNLAMAPPFAKDMQGRCQTLISAYQANDAKRLEYQAQVSSTTALEEALLPEIRAALRLLKAQPGYTDDIGRSLGIVAAPGSSALPATVRPTASAEARRGLVRIRFRKSGLDGVNVYGRRAGETAWRLLGRDNQSPFEDRAPLDKPGVPEVREYQLIGVQRDQEVGLASDTLTVTYAG